VTTITAPALPEKPAPHSFPFVAAAAPVVLGVAMFVVTRSPLSLLFAALGPLIAIGSLVDARLQARRGRRRESARFDREMAAALADVEAAHDAERDALVARFPAAVELTPVWSRSSSCDLRVGLGEVQSTVRIDGIRREHGGLVTAAELIPRAPVVVDASEGIGVVGSGVAVDALVRSLVIQLAARLSPAEWVIRAPDDHDWVDGLPHAREQGELAFFGADGTVIPLSVAATRARLPVDAAVVVEASTVELRDGTRRELLAVERVSEAQAVEWARRCSVRARATGFDLSRRAIAASVDLGDLEQPTGSMCAAIGVDATGAVELDLVRDGPHAVIGGTTGSGKSELLLTWVLALARGAPPTEITFLFVDFKGGATFGALQALPHCVGLLTDLDDEGARRAFESLGAELRYRERFLAAAGARSIDGASGLARLVIVVDEFAALATGSPELHALFADLAARGRSLGVHLVLCTQRPVGVVRDAVFANVALRISLRVHDTADSIALLGVPDAARLPPGARGRALLATGVGPPRELQLALASDDDVRCAIERWPGGGPVRVPWLEPLPRRLERADLPRVREGIPFGLSDLPHEQSQPVAVWLPEVDGHLLVIGASRAGTSTALANLAGEWLPRDAGGAWDAITALLESVRAGDCGRLVIIDDVDVLLTRLGPDYDAEVVHRLIALLREGPAAGLRLAIGAQRITGQLGPIVSLCGARLILRMADRQDHVLAGGAGADYRSDLPPGGGLWRGHRVQVALAQPPTEAPVETPHFEPPRTFAVVAERPAEFERRLADVCSVECSVVGPEGAIGLTVTSTRPTAIIGDPDAWQAQWGALTRVRQSMPVVIDGCSLADYRVLTRSRQLPPPLEHGEFWVLEPDGTVARARL
jgi:S-DNA-T family DNA segregation ATPase FtsK/SpoIIIE